MFGITLIDSVIYLVIISTLFFLSRISSSTSAALTFPSSSMSLSFSILFVNSIGENLGLINKIPSQLPFLLDDKGKYIVDIQKWFH